MHYVVEGTVVELFQKFQDGQIPPFAKVEIVWDEPTGADGEPNLTAFLETVRQKFSVNYEATSERLAKLEEAKKETLALFSDWQKEDAEQTAEECAEEEQMYAEIERDGIPRFNLPNRFSQKAL